MTTIFKEDTRYTEMKKQLRAVLYTRFSTTMQKIESIEAQEKAMYSYADANGLKVLHSYSDQGETGKTSENRAEFQKMIEDSSKGLFDVVLIHKVDRFARNVEEYLHFEKMLNANGVELIAVNSPFDNSPMGKAAKMLMIVFAEMFSDNLSNEVKSKMTAHAENGSLLNSAPLGYKAITVNGIKEFEIVPEEAETIKFIFSQYASGVGYRAISKALKEKGIKTRRGKDFSHKALNHILTNEAYIGNFTFNKSRKISNDKTSRYTVHNDEQVVRVENRIPPLIDKATWNMVQTRFNEFNKKAKRKTSKENRHYLLTGKAVCGVCGKSFVGCSKGRGYYYYQCSERNTKNSASCSSKNIRAAELEETVLDVVQDKFLTDEVLDRVQALLKENIETAYSELNAKIKGLENEKMKLENRSNKLLTLYYDEAISKSEFKEEKQAIKSRLDKLDNEIYSLKSGGKSVKPKDVMNYIANMKSTEMTEETKQVFIDTVIESVVIKSPDEIELTLYLFRGSNSPNDDYSPLISGDKLKNGFPISPISPNGIYIAENGTIVIKFELGI